MPSSASAIQPSELGAWPGVARQAHPPPPSKRGSRFGPGPGSVPASKPVEASGGVIAYEMARRLQTRGEHIGLVALFDSLAPSRLEIDANDQARILTELVGFLNGFYRLGIEARLGHGIAKQAKRLVMLLVGLYDLEQLTLGLFPFVQRTQRPAQHDAAVGVLRVGAQPALAHVNRVARPPERQVRLAEIDEGGVARGARHGGGAPLEVIARDRVGALGHHVPQQR